MINLSQRKAICPECGEPECKRHSTYIRTLSDIIGKVEIKSSKHYCHKCKKYFSIDHPMYPRKYRYSKRIIDMGIQHNGTLEEISLYFKKQYGLDIGMTTIHDWKVGAYENS